jgi:hypothetical protein
MTSPPRQPAISVAEPIVDRGADFVCGDGNPFCSFFAQFIQSTMCDLRLRSSTCAGLHLQLAGPQSG